MYYILYYGRLHYVFIKKLNLKLFLYHFFYFVSWKSILYLFQYYFVISVNLFITFIYLILGIFIIYHLFNFYNSSILNAGQLFIMFIFKNYLKLTFMLFYGVISILVVLSTLFGIFYF